MTMLPSCCASQSPRRRASGFSPAPRRGLGAFSRAGGSAAQARGFTLIEIILATIVLALGLTIAFASLHTATGSVRRAEAAAARNEHLRAVQGFMYRMLRSAQPLVLSRDPETQGVTFLDGTREQVRFVAAMPGYLSRGGPYVMTLKIAPSNAGDGGRRLQFAYAMLVDEKPLEDDSKLPPEDLLDGIADAHFEYRGLGPDGEIETWHESWDRVSELPLEIRLQLRFADPSRPWPAFVTGLPLGFARAQAAAVVAPGSILPPRSGGGK